MPRNANAVLVDRRDNDGLNAGEYYFLTYPDDQETAAGMLHGCPCGCGGRSVLWFAGYGRGRAEWHVTGDWPNVTLSPSIGIRFDGQGERPVDGYYHWHGYLRSGVFEES